ncbi:hypothetical protein Nmel_006364, partial [Mimus melanotis]
MRKLLSKLGLLLDPPLPPSWISKTLGCPFAPTQPANTGSCRSRRAVKTTQIRMGRPWSHPRVPGGSRATREPW